MAELSMSERLQPSLLDRLTDDNPGKRTESRDSRVISVDRLRQCVLRDLSWLFNAGRLEQTDDLSDYPEVARSVLNYGMTDFSGMTLSTVRTEHLQDIVQEVIWSYEPRILRDTVKVRASVDDDAMHRNAVMFEIQGTLWAQPMPLRMFMRSEIDLETGHVQVVERPGR